MTTPKTTVRRCDRCDTPYLSTGTEESLRGLRFCDECGKKFQVLFHAFLNQLDDRADTP